MEQTCRLICPPDSPILHRDVHVTLEVDVGEMTTPLLSTNHPE